MIREGMFMFIKCTGVTYIVEVGNDDLLSALLIASDDKDKNG